MLLKAFQQFLEDNRELLVRQRIEIAEVYTTPSNASVPGMYADFYTETRIGRITIWSTGDCDLEILDADSACQLFWEHRLVSPSTDFASAFQKFMEKLTDDK